MRTIVFNLSGSQTQAYYKQTCQHRAIHITIIPLTSRYPGNTILYMKVVTICVAKQHPNTTTEQNVRLHTVWATPLYMRDISSMLLGNVLLSNRVTTVICDAIHICLKFEMHAAYF